MKLIHVEPKNQKLILLENDKEIVTYDISTGKNGLGELIGSEKTPRGWHRIRVKIGDGYPLNSVFVGRRPTGEIYKPEFATRYPDRDWILTRIMWLCGEEVGQNRFGKVDSMRRFIYIHGTPDSEPMGQAGSKGCIRMRNHDIIEFFDRVPVGTKIYIQSD